MKLIDDIDMSTNAQVVYTKRILQIAYMYPYLVSKIDDYILDKFNVDKDYLKDYTLLLLEESLLKKTMKWPLMHYILQ